MSQNPFQRMARERGYVPGLPPHMAQRGAQGAHSTAPDWMFALPWSQNPSNPANAGGNQGAPFPTPRTRQPGGRYAGLPPLPDDPSAPLPPGYQPRGHPGSPLRNPNYAGMQYNDRQRQYWIDQFGSDQGWERFVNPGFNNNQDRRDARTNFYETQWANRLGQDATKPGMDKEGAMVNGSGMQSRVPQAGGGLVSALQRGLTGRQMPNQPPNQGGKSGFGGPVSLMPAGGQPGPGPIRQNPPGSGAGKGGFGGVSRIGG